MAHSLTGILIFVVIFYTFKIKMLNDNIKELEKIIISKDLKITKLHDKNKKKEKTEEEKVRDQLLKDGYPDRLINKIIQQMKEEGRL